MLDLLMMPLTRKIKPRNESRKKMRPYVTLAIPVTHFDISDDNFVEIVFWPRALADQPVKSFKAFIPKQEITLIVASLFAAS